MTKSQYVAVKNLVLAENPETMIIIMVQSIASVLSIDLLQAGRWVLSLHNVAEEYDMFMTSIQTVDRYYIHSSINV